MADLEREAHFHRGPRFFRDERGVDMFEHRIDSRSMVGPRIATKADKEAHMKPWSEFCHSIIEDEDRKLKRKKG